MEMEPAFAPCCRHVNSQQNAATLGKIIHHCPVYCDKDESRLRGQVNVARLLLIGYTGERDYMNAAYGRLLRRYQYARVQYAKYETHVAITKECSPAGEKSSRRVCFDETQHHRPEAEYRHQALFDTTSRAYKPGLYADSSPIMDPLLFERGSFFSTENLGIMHYTVASVCHHELSYTCTPVGHSTTLSKTVKLCDTCELFATQEETVRRIADDLGRFLADDGEYDVDSMYNTVRLAPHKKIWKCWVDMTIEEIVEENEKAWQMLHKRFESCKKVFFGSYGRLAAMREEVEDFEDPSRPTVNRKGKCTVIARGPGPKGLDAMFCKNEKPRTRRVRFCSKQIHRPESEYRWTSEYRRRTSRHTRGTWADKTGKGFWDTSGYRRRQNAKQARAERRKSAAEEAS